MVHIMDKPKQLAQIFKVLSVETRIRILQFLNNRTLCVNAIAARLNITAAAVSQHLRIMRDAHIVETDKKGYYVHYRVNQKTLERWRQHTEKLLSPLDV